jgi:hypothetical protein
MQPLGLAADARQAGAAMAGAARLPHQAAFYSELLPIPQSDRAAVGHDAQKRYITHMLRNVRTVRRRDARFDGSFVPCKTHWRSRAGAGRRSLQKLKPSNQLFSDGTMSNATQIRAPSMPLASVACGVYDGNKTRRPGTGSISCIPQGAEVP